MLAARDEKISKLAEANAKLSPRDDTLGQFQARFESRFERLERALALRDGQIDRLKEANGKLSERCDELANNNILLESGRKHTQEKLKSQSSDIKLLEAALLAGRETAEQKITELTGELQREREEHFAAERESAMIRREIAALLSKLTGTTQSIH